MCHLNVQLRMKDAQKTVLESAVFFVFSFVVAVVTAHWGVCEHILYCDTFMMHSITFSSFTKGRNTSVKSAYEQKSFLFAFMFRKKINRILQY